jgi:DNA-directed RNA polymerase subunit RPC12/RpoP
VAHILKEVIRKYQNFSREEIKTDFTPDSIGGKMKKRIAKVTGEKIKCPYCGYIEKQAWAVDFKYRDQEFSCMKCHRSYIVLAGSVGREENERRK